MSVKAVSVLFFAWLLSSFVQGLVSNVYGGQDDLQTVLTLSAVKIRTLIFIPIPVPNIEFVGAVGRLLTWDHPWFAGNMQPVRWLTVLVITGAASYGFFTGILPVLLSAANQITNTIRALNPLSLFRG